ncbi:hypothetical protein ACI3PL_27995, partial [Lacticaseibacillus paracasei]
IQWPTADSSIKATELHSELIKRNLSSLDSHGKKLKKEDMARIIGRAEAIETLSNVNFKKMNVNMF